MSLKQTSNLRIGPADFTFNGVDLGFTLGGVNIEVERNYQDLTVDMFGDSPLDKAVTGNKATIKTTFAEPIVELLTYLNPDGENKTGTAGSRTGFGTDAGILMAQYAFQLTIHPRKSNSVADQANLAEDIVYYKAVNVENIKLNYEVKGQRVVEVTFEALVDVSKPSGRRLGHIGLTNIS